MFTPIWRNALRLLRPTMLMSGCKSMAGLAKVTGLHFPIQELPLDLF
jgi:hypothetical protein